jgi:hypothetical protein
MEPLTLATSLATIISLLASFKTEQKDTSDDEFKDFMEWLIQNNQADIMELLSLNTQATIGIKAILNQDRELLFAKLEAIDEVVSKIASSIDGFDKVVSAIRPDHELSVQAKSVLIQIVKSGASKFLQSKAMGRLPIYSILGGVGGQIEYDEPQFIEDDLSTLVNLGLLNLDYNDNGNELWVVTRSAAKLVAAHDK